MDISATTTPRAAGLRYTGDQQNGIARLGTPGEFRYCETGRFRYASQEEHRTGDRVGGKKLGNTPTICRKCYVRPAVLESYLDGRSSRAGLVAATATGAAQVKPGAQAGSVPTA